MVGRSKTDYHKELWDCLIQSRTDLFANAARLLQAYTRFIRNTKSQSRHRSLLNAVYLQIWGLMSFDEIIDFQRQLVACSRGTMITQENANAYKSLLHMYSENHYLPLVEEESNGLFVDHGIIIAPDINDQEKIAIRQCVESLRAHFPHVGVRTDFYDTLNNSLQTNTPYHGDNASIKAICDSLLATLNSLPRWRMMPDIHNDLHQYAKREIAYALHDCEAFKWSFAKKNINDLNKEEEAFRELLKEKSTPLGEIQAYLKDSSLRNQPTVSSDMLVSLNEPKWEFKPFGNRRVVCFPPGNRDNIEYLPWVGYREGNCVRLFNFVGTGFRPKRVEAGTEVNSMEVERDEVHEEQDEEQDEVQDVQDPILNVGMCVDPWEYDIRNTFAYL